ncbi:MAG: hypothetical protein ABIH92_05880 [Nanoarchaeota archaeon]
MKKVIFLVMLLVFSQAVQAVSSDLRDVYAPKETMIGEFSGGILASILREQVDLVRDGHIDVAFEYDVGKLGNNHYIWLMAPQNEGDYTLRIRDIIALVDGVPQVVDYEKDFRVEGQMIDYSISPGFVFVSGDFEISATLYGSSQDITVNFPETRDVSLIPGTNYIGFSIGGIVGIHQTMISVGRYSMPSYIIGVAYYCGDGQIDSIEVCDGGNLNGESCTTVPGGYISGGLACSANCLSFDTGNCELPEEGPECDSNHLDLCLTDDNCTVAGGYWYGDVCNRYEEGAECDSEHVGLCLTQGTCLDSGGYWYGDGCNDEPEPVCDSEHLNLCLTYGACYDAGGYWYGDGCNDEPEPVQECGDDLVTGNETCDGTDLRGENCTSLGYVGGELSCNEDCLGFNMSSCSEGSGIFSGPPNFIISPGVIRDTVLFEDEPGYSFVIKNQGVNPITDLAFDYDGGRFRVYPDSDVSIGVNESAQFNLTLINPVKNNMRGVVVAYSRDVFEYLLFTINVTTDEGSVGIEYSRNSSVGGPSYRCSELSGIFCTAGEICTGREVQTLDGSDCCVEGWCEKESGGGSKTWIGYLIAGIVLLGILILYVKYKKTKPPGNPMKTRLSQVEKKMP